MISALRGPVLYADGDQVVIDVGGVGFAVSVPGPLARTAVAGSELVLHTHLVVREDALALFGFAEREELRVFTQLLGVTGVGPKSALGVLSSLTVAQIADAVAAEDDAPFRRVSGIGPKTAKLIVVQLTGKLAVPVAGAAQAPAGAATTIVQLAAALGSLGWNERVSAEVAARVVADAPAGERGSVPSLLKRALAELGPARAEHSSV